MNDHTSDVMVTATCNDISKLPPEMTRAERFDGVFFVDLPDAQQRQAIWRIYIDAFDLDANQKLPADENWTGAEIKAVLQAGGAARSTTGGGGSQRGAGAGDSGGVGGETADMGQWPMLERKRTGNLPIQRQTCRQLTAAG